jgi:rfaE bifunctional protein kinase chain/domain
MEMVKPEKVEGLTHREFILSHLPRFQERKILVIGDLGLDEYVEGDVRRISPEAPVPVVEVGRSEQRLGLSGNVAQNITSLGGKAVLLSVVGDDEASNSLRQMLRAAKVEADLVVDSQRPTTRKLRVMAQHHHIVRVDYEKKTYISEDMNSQILQRLERYLPGVDGVIVQDYAKGLLHKNLIQAIIQQVHRARKRVLVDPHKTTPIGFYRGADLMTPNYDESMALAGISSDDLVEPEELLQRMGARLVSEIGSEQMVMTLGSRGMRLIEKNGAGWRLVDLPTYARQVFDVTGAGDTVIATMALAWLSNFSLEQACIAANFAAGVVVSKVGCVPCTVADLREFIDSH